MLRTRATIAAVRAIDVEPAYLAIADVLRAPGWMRDAACIEAPDVDFFPERGVSTAPAKAVCGDCLVRTECLGYALDRGIRDGIWGGTSERERRKLARDPSARPRRARCLHCQRDYLTVSDKAGYCSQKCRSIAIGVPPPPWMPDRARPRRRAAGTA